MLIVSILLRSPFSPLFTLFFLSWEAEGEMGGEWQDFHFAE